MITYLFSYPYGDKSVKHPPKIKNARVWHPNPVVLVMGATSTKGQKVLELLKDKPLTLVAVSRRETRWLKLKEQFPNVSWYKGDIRLSHEMSYLFEQIKTNYGSIDYVINLTYIPGSIDSVDISSLRVKNDVYFKLSHAYDQELLPKSNPAGKIGDENPLFTNLIGHIVLKNICIQYGCSNVIMLLGNDRIVNELIKSFEENTNSSCIFKSIKGDELAKISYYVE